MIGLKGLQDDINIAHSVHATQLQSDVSTAAVYTVLKPSNVFCTYCHNFFYKIFLFNLYTLYRLNTRKTLLKDTLSSNSQWTC